MGDKQSTHGTKYLHHHTNIQLNHRVFSTTLKSQHRLHVLHPKCTDGDGGGSSLHFTNKTLLEVIYVSVLVKPEICRHGGG